MNAPAPISNAPQPYRFRVSDFVSLAESGAFADCGKTELIEGEIFFMNSQWSRHARVKSRLFSQLVTALQTMNTEYEALSEVSVHLTDGTMPEPDIVLTSYKGDHAVPRDLVALIVEVSDTTLEIDLGRKAALYAQADIPEYWVVDIEGKRIVRHSGPGDERYRVCDEVAFGMLLEAVTIAGLVVETGRLG